jgi:Mg-chelatase subunit ChlD
MFPRVLTVAAVLAAAALSTAQGGTPPGGVDRPGAGKPGAAPPVAADPAPPPLGQAATGRIVHTYQTAEHWALRALCLLSLGTDWHPDGVAIVLAALADKDERLHAYAVETMLRTNDRVVAALAQKELLAALIDLLRRKNEHLRTRTEAALARLAPAAGCKGHVAWQRWWRDHEGSWAPAAWAPIATQATGGTATQQVIDRAFDLRDAGLEVVFVLDTTGSMQLAIDAARDAIDDITALLAGITPKLELGLVHYKDLGDMSDGAKLLEPLTRQHKKVQDRLAKLIASGGGDAPERVEKGIEAALAKDVGWTKDANRMLLIVGDAPPHMDTMDDLLAMVKKAHEHPFAKGKAAVTGPKETKVRPFITSALATSEAAMASFSEIAKAGGGTAVRMDLGPQRPGGRGEARGEARPAGTRAATAAEQVAEHVLLLSFGGANDGTLREFVRVFFAYRRAGAFDR